MLLLIPKKITTIYTKSVTIIPYLIKILENKLYSLNPLIAITPKQRRQPAIAYGMEPLKSSM